MNKSGSPLAHPAKNASFELPFFILLTVVLLGISIFSIAVSPDLQTPARLLPFCGLMLAHLGLYWLVFLRDPGLPLILVLLAIQGLVALGLNLLGQNLALVFGLYAGLMGLASGLFLKTRRWAVAAIAYYLALCLLSYILVTGWGQIEWWLLTVIPTATFTIIYVALYGRQSEARTRAQALAAELETANRHLAAYASQVEELTLANERQRMARELHDTLSQGLAGLILQLEAVEAHLAGSRPERARAIVRQTMEQARATLADARSAIDDLRRAPASPPDQAAASPHLWFEAIVRRETDRFTAATGIPVQLEIRLPSPLADPAALETGMRILAEGLTNAARHARASQVLLRLAQDGDCYDMLLQDDGVGFDPQGAADQAGHYGLLGMSERARLAGGTLEVTSRPGAGTTLHLRLPVKAQAGPEVAP